MFAPTEEVREFRSDKNSDRRRWLNQTTSRRQKLRAGLIGHLAGSVQDNIKATSLWNALAVPVINRNISAELPGHIKPRATDRSHACAHQLSKLPRWPLDAAASRIYLYPVLAGF
jgi:hypothetical protein